MDTTEMLSVSDYESYAVGKLNKGHEAHVFGGSFHEQTLEDNVKAFTRYRFRPRVLRDVSSLDMSTTVLGHPISCPVGIAPMGRCCLVHPDGELGLAKACAELQLPFANSMGSTVSMEDISAGAPNCLRWLMLYIYNREFTELLVRKAEKNGYSAIIVTVDSVVPGRRLSAFKAGTEPPTKDPEKFANADVTNVKRVIDPSLTWKDMEWVVNMTKLPVIVKGILTGEDAKEAVAHGVAAVWVSNHGGRNLDGVPASLDVLAEVVNAVAGRCEVYMDGGVRSGYDVTKAIALGARAVFVGRPAMWGLVYKGAEGVTSLLQLVKDEMTNAMMFLGVRSVSELNRSYVVHESKLPTA